MKNGQVGAVILAGGKSRRFGRDKALYPFRGRPLIANMVEVVEKITNDILIITNSPQSFDFLPYPKYRDLIPESGPLGGIYTGLYYSQNRLNIVLPCDMPFVTPACLRYLVENSNGYDVTVPYHNGLQEPLCAVYSRDCLPFIKTQIESKDYQVFQFYDKVKTQRLLFDSKLDFYHHRLFFNINSQKDLAEENIIVKD